MFCNFRGEETENQRSELTSLKGVTKYAYGWVSNCISSHLLHKGMYPLKGRHQESLLPYPQIQN